LIDRRSSLPETSWRQPFSVSEVRLADGEITLFAAHFSLPAILEGEEKHEFDALTHAILRVSSPSLVAGDFNAAPWSAKMKTLAGSTGLRITKSPEATWPSFLPTFVGIPIDHVVVSDALSVHSRAVLSAPGSDHRAIEVKFSLPPDISNKPKVE
jgi:endonuclease/exonuclease/phosphatase (EEP) superfamily protein YafD